MGNFSYIILRQSPTNEDANPVQGAGESYFERTLRCTISVAIGHWTTWGHHHSGDRVVVALCELVCQTPPEDLFPPCR